MKLKHSGEDKEKEIIKNKINRSPPINVYFYKTISCDIFNNNFYNNRACLFTYCKDNNVYIVYGVISLDLECYDIIGNKKFILISKLHNDSFDSCRHFFDKINKRNLILTSSFDKHVKVMNFKKEDSEVIIDLGFESYYRPIINTACFINNKIVVPFANVESGNIEIYNMNSICTGKIEKCGFILGLSSYYWKKTKKYFILVANLEGILAYNEDDLSLYKEFKPNVKATIFNGFDEGYIIEKNKLLILINPCFYFEYLFFWDFVNGDLICKLSMDSGISDICIWDNNYIFASFNEIYPYQFILINTKYNKIENKYSEKDKNSRLCGIKVLRNKSKGDFLITFNISGKLNLYTINRPRKRFLYSIYMCIINLIILLSIFYILINIFKYKILG